MASRATAAEPTAPGAGEARILELLDGFLESRVLMTAFRLDLFTLLADRSLPVDEILERLGLPTRSGTILLDACLALDLLEAGPEGLRTREDVRALLVRGPDLPFRLPTYLIDYYDHVYRHLVDLEELIRTDGASSTFELRPYFTDDVNRIDGDMAARYAGYMDSTMLQIAEVVLETVDFSDCRRLLDVCGGPGTFVRAVLRRHPHLRGAFLDVPAVVRIGARELTSEDPALVRRIVPIEGDVFRTKLPEDVDVVSMCRSAHDWGLEEVRRIFRRVHAALATDGRFLLVERMLPEAFSTEARNLYLRSIYFLLKSKSNAYRRPSQYHELLAEVGFGEVEVIRPARDPNRFFRGLHVVVARKLSS